MESPTSGGDFCTHIKEKKRVQDPDVLACQGGFELAGGGVLCTGNIWAEEALAKSPGQKDGVDDAKPHGDQVVEVPVRGAGGDGVGDERADDGADAVHGMQDAEPAVRVANGDGEGVGLGVLEGDADAREEEGGQEERERRLPEDERVPKRLDNRSEHQRAARAEPRADVDVGERGAQPAAEVDQVDERNRQQADSVCRLQIRDQNPDRRVWPLSTTHALTPLFVPFRPGGLFCRCTYRSARPSDT